MARSPVPTGPQRAIDALHRVEDAMLAVLLGAMILLAPLQIALRGVLGTGTVWVDPLLRVLVLWLGLLGAVAASRESRQITMDVLARMLTGRARAAVGAVTNVFTSAVAGLVAYHGARFVASEFHFESVAFSGIPSWEIASVIPFAFAAIAMRHVGFAAQDLKTLFRGEGEGEGDDDDGRRPGTPPR